MSSPRERQSKAMEKVDIIKEIIDLQRKVNRILRDHDSTSWMKLEMTSAQLKSLFFIDNEGITYFRKLAEALGVTPPNMTGIVSRLVAMGLVNRRENPDDRRILILEVTEKGKAQLASLRDIHIKKMSSALNNLNLKDLSYLQKGMKALAKSAAEQS